MRDTFIYMFGIAFLLLFGLNGYMHEAAHQQIYASYGINSTIHLWQDFPDMTTTADKPCPTEVCTLANNLNEVQGYNSTALFLLVGFGLFIIIIYLDLILNKQKRANEFS